MSIILCNTAIHCCMHLVSCTMHLAACPNTRYKAGCTTYCVDSRLAVWRMRQEWSMMLHICDGEHNLHLLLHLYSFEACVAACNTVHPGARCMRKRLSGNRPYYGALHQNPNDVYREMLWTYIVENWLGIVLLCLRQTTLLCLAR